ASNAGPLASSAATLTFALAAGVSIGGTPPTGCTISNGTATCTLASLAVGASQSFAFSATANTAGSNVASSTITAATNATDADASNNTAQTTVMVNNPPPPAPPSTGSGGGGGGSLDYLTLLALAMFAACQIFFAILRRA